MKTTPESPLPPQIQFLVYRAEDGLVKLDVQLAGETDWFTQSQESDLFQTTVANVSIHLPNIFAAGGVTATAPVKEFLPVWMEGNSYEV